MKTKIFNIFNWRRFFALFALLILIIVSIKHPIGAQTVTKGYNSDNVLQRGMIVSFDGDDKEKIEATKKEKSKEAFGVVVSANDAPVTLSSEGQKYFVATSGSYEVLVSNQNGKINKGDLITISSVPGIGMKANDSNKYILGKALDAYDKQKTSVSSAKLKDASGKDFDVSIIRLYVQLNIGINPNHKSAVQELPSAIKNVTEAIAGKSVGVLRGYIALIIFILSALAASSLMYGGVKSAIISVGRNPLSKKSILRSMMQVVLSGLIIFITGLIGVYLILKL